MKRTGCPDVANAVCSTGAIRRKAAGIVVGTLAALVVVVVGGLYLLVSTLESGLFEGRPTKVTFVDTAVGIVDPRELKLNGEVLLTGRSRAGLDLTPVTDLSRQPTPVLGGSSVSSIGPDARYALAYGPGRWQAVRLSDLHVVAEIEGGKPLFLDLEQMVLLGEGDDCQRRDATVINLAQRTYRTVKLSGSKARLNPVAVDGGQIVAQRLNKGDSSCASAGLARVDSASGNVTTVTTTDHVAAATGSHAWMVSGDRTMVFDGTAVATTYPSRVVAFPVGDRVLYAEELWPPVYGQLPPPTGLRLAAASGPQPSDPARDELREPRDLIVAPGGNAVLISHAMAEPPDDHRGWAVSRCSLPDLRCTRLAHLTPDTRLLAVVPASVFTG